MNKIIGFMLIFVVATMFTGCVHNKNRKAFQPSILKTQHRVTLPA